MKRIKLTRNLYLDEYFDPTIYKDYERKNSLKRLEHRLDHELVMADQALRTIFGVTTINNWAIGGGREHSGFRTPQSPYFSKDSMHSFGKASDKLFKDYDAEEIISFIRKLNQGFDKERLILKYRPDIKSFQLTILIESLLKIKGLEIGTSWVHTDTRNCNSISFFNA